MKGSARPWKGYDAGVRWAAAVSQDPARWGLLNGGTVEGAARMTLAERTRVLDERQERAGKKDWREALKPALARARAEGKPILFFQLVGDLDLEGC